MNRLTNPFEFEAATKLSPQDIVEYYCDDFNFSRFVRSTRNVFFEGERGVGKTMTLKYFSLPIEALKPKCDLAICCIYISCQTPLNYRREDELLNEYRAAAVSEHHFAIQIMQSIISEMARAENLFRSIESEAFIESLENWIGVEIPRSANSVWQNIEMALQVVSRNAERSINTSELEPFYKIAMSFANGVIPLLKGLKALPELAGSHFSLMIDDAHMLSPRQTLLLNSWVSYRDNTLFSFKVASTKSGRFNRRTASGGGILEGHDFVKVDMLRPHQNKNSDFGKLAEKIVSKRLIKAGIRNTTPLEFFPEHPSVLRELKTCENEVRQEAIKMYGEDDKKTIGDHVYKHTRARFFQNRKPQANLPVYAGFETISRLSTGVVRALLEPCYRMFDAAVSESDGDTPESIAPTVQDKIIKGMSQSKWNWIKEELPRVVECTTEEATQVLNIFEQLATLFQHRLKNHKSEPRATVFIITGSSESQKKLKRLFEISHEAQLLFSYSGPAKENSKRVRHYVPNRMLWPVRGLDVYDRHAKVSISAEELVRVANGGKITLKEPNKNQLDLFGEENCES